MSILRGADGCNGLHDSDDDAAVSSVVRSVTAAVTVMEDDPAFNAGFGSVLNEMGEVEMDAAVMEGNSLRFGAVASIGTSIMNHNQKLNCN
jgi:beta-aspartyl-peptidase (threonine type)